MTLCLPISAYVVNVVEKGLAEDLIKVSVLSCSP